MSVVDAKPFAISSSLDSLLLLLLLLIEYAAFRQRNRLAQNVDVADVVGENENQRGIEIGALRVAEAAMRFHDGAERVVGPGKVRSGRQRNDDPQFKPEARASAASSAGRVG